MLGSGERTDGFQASFLPTCQSSTMHSLGHMAWAQWFYLERSKAQWLCAVPSLSLYAEGSRRQVSSVPGRVRSLMHVNEAVERKRRWTDACCFSLTLTRRDSQMVNSAAKVTHQHTDWDREHLFCVLHPSCLVFSSAIIKWINNNNSVPMHIYSLNLMLILAVQSIVPERKGGEQPWLQAKRVYPLER